MSRPKDFLRLLGRYMKLYKQLCLIGEPTDEFMEIQDEELAVEAELLEHIPRPELTMIVIEQMQADKKFMKAMGYCLVDGKWQPVGGWRD